MVPGLIALLSAQLVGEILARLLQLPIPGPVVGMLLLFIVLMLRGGPGPSLAQLSQNLIRYLPLILIPPSVALMDHLPLLRHHALLLSVVILGTTLVSLLVAALLGQQLLGKDNTP